MSGGSTDSRPGQRCFDALIAGAGATGLFCARQAARRGLTVALLDRQDRPGRKLSMAGGGMGNVTNRVLDARHYVGGDCSVCGQAFRHFGTDDVLRLLAGLDIPWEERDFGQIFGLRPAAGLAAGLARQCREAGVETLFGREIGNIRRERLPEGGFRFSLRAGDCTLSAPQLVVATGSPAWPQAGSSDFGARLAAQWGQRVVPFRPVLVPLIMPPDWALAGLEGISLNACLTVLPAVETAAATPQPGDPCGFRPLLFTHRGLSGPAALVASCFWQPGDALQVDFLPETSVADLLHNPAHGKLLVRSLVSRHLPSRLTDRLIPEDLARRKVAELGKKDRQRLADAVHGHTVTPAGTEGARKAEAAAGGVVVGPGQDELSRRLESRLTPGLFFCGEVVDVTGLLGGYNLHWAFASAQLVARALRPAGETTDKAPSL